MRLLFYSRLFFSGPLSGADESDRKERLGAKGRRSGRDPYLQKKGVFFFNVHFAEALPASSYVTR